LTIGNIITAHNLYYYASCGKQY